MKKLSIIPLAILALSLHSCRKDYAYVQPVVVPPANLSFATDIYPILTNPSYSCDGCHGSGAQAPDLSSASVAFTDLTTGTTYVNTAAPSSSSFYVAVTSAYTGPSGQMPAGGPPFLTANEQAKILAWIQQGAKP